ncbi:MAG: hypothetical protein HYV60_23325 [Planctomycetia bacterium]|nr:hypothetical protein [Planctomycetia bacterium]
MTRSTSFVGSGWSWHLFSLRETQKQRTDHKSITTQRRLTPGLVQHAHGVIDEVRISAVPRYTKDFTPIDRFEPDEHTLALYHFDEGRGDVLRDSSGNGHHGKIHNANWVQPGGSPISRPPLPYALRTCQRKSGFAAKRKL